MFRLCYYGHDMLKPTTLMGNLANLRMMGRTLPAADKVRFLKRLVLAPETSVNASTMSLFPCIHASDSPFTLNAVAVWRRARRSATVVARIRGCMSSRSPVSTCYCHICLRISMCQAHATRSTTIPPATTTATSTAATTLLFLLPSSSSYYDNKMPLLLLFFLLSLLLHPLHSSTITVTTATAATAAATSITTAAATATSIVPASRVSLLFLLQDANGKVHGGRDLAQSAAYPLAFSRALFRLWFATWQATRATQNTAASHGLQAP